MAPSTWAYNHGLLLFRDANQYLRFLVNRFGTAGAPPEERGVTHHADAVLDDAAGLLQHGI